MMLSLLPASAAEPIPVTALHPIMGDLARSVGGEYIQVHDLLPLGGDPHTFEPTANDLARLSKAKLVLASGKKLEAYLDNVRAATQAEVFEVGRRIPSIMVNTKNPLFICCPAHAHGSLDPHWWQSPRYMGRAARYVADALSKVDPAHADAYKKGARDYVSRMDKLDKWVRKQVAAIPRKDRKLVTAHLAFGYFCKEYGFQAMGLQGLARLQEPTQADLVEAIKTVKEEKLAVAFPEKLAHPKLLENLRRETGIRIGRPLLADTMSEEHKDYEAMIRHNVAAIVEGFFPAKSPPESSQSKPP